MAKPVRLPSGRWRVRVYVGKGRDGRPHYKSVTADTKAECLYKAWAIADRPKDQPVVEDLTLREVVDQYIEISQTLSPTTLAAYKKVREYAFPDLMDKPVSALTDVVMQQAINAELKRTGYHGRALSPKTVKNEYGVISGALRTICKLTFNVRLPKIQRGHDDLPDPELVMAAIAGTKVELAAMLAMWMSLSMSEIRGIMCSSIRGEVISIDRVTVDIGAEHITKEAAKTATRKRLVKAPPYILELIKRTDAWREWQRGGSDGFIVPETRNAVYYHFRKVMDAAGLSITFHDLRHIYASTMLTTLGAPSKVVQDAGGWSSPYVMDRVYSNMFDSARSEWILKRDELMAEILENMTRRYDTKNENVDISRLRRS